MTDPVRALVLDLVDWIGDSPRPYADVIEAWRTSCPRLPVWETALANGWIERSHRPGSAAMVSVTAAGRRVLAERRRAAAGRSLRPVRAGT